MSIIPTASRHINLPDYDQLAEKAPHLLAKLANLPAEILATIHPRTQEQAEEA